MAEPALRLLTVSDYLARHDGERDELLEGVPVALAAVLPGHAILTGELARVLGNALVGRPQCSVRVETGIAPDGLDGNRCYLPDLVVACRPPRPGERLTEEPVLIVEILSESTEGYDRRVKLPDYRSIPSVVEILFIDPARIFAEVHRRFEGDRWLVDLLRRPGDVLRLDSVGLSLPLGDLYQRIALDEP